MRNLFNHTHFASTVAHKHNHHHTPPWSTFNSQVIHPFLGNDKANTSDDVFRHLFAVHREEYSDYLDIYTDGSKSNNVVGCAYVCQNVTISHSLSLVCSTFTAEIIAIKEALTYIKNRNYKKCIIYTDSKSTLDAINSFHQLNSLLSDIQRLHKHLTSSGVSILFCWVPSHVGIKGNELADKAAKEACIPLNHDVPYTDLKIAIKTLFQ